MSIPLPKKPFTLSGSLAKLSFQKKSGQMKTGKKGNTKDSIKSENVNNSKEKNIQMEETSSGKKALIKINREFQPSSRVIQKMKVLSQKNSPTKSKYLPRSNSSKENKVKEQKGTSKQKEEKMDNTNLMNALPNNSTKEKEPNNIKYENKLTNKTNSENNVVDNTSKEKTSNTTLNHVRTKSKLINLKESSLSVKKKNKHEFPKKVENLSKDSNKSSNKSVSVSISKDLHKSSSTSFSKSSSNSSNKSSSLNLSENTESPKKLKKNIQEKPIKQELKTVAAPKNLEHDEFLKKKQGLIQKSIDMKQKKKDDLEQLIKEGRKRIRRINTKELMNYESPFNTDAPSLFCENAYKISTLSPIENKLNAIRSILENKKDEITGIIKNCIENNQQVYSALKIMLDMLIEGDNCVLAKINHSETLKKEVEAELDNLINELINI